MIFFAGNATFWCIFTCSRPLYRNTFVIAVSYVVLCYLLILWSISLGFILCPCPNWGKMLYSKVLAFAIASVAVGLFSMVIKGIHAVAQPGICNCKTRSSGGVRWWQQMLNAIRWIKQSNPRKKIWQSFSHLGLSERDGSLAYCNAQTLRRDKLIVRLRLDRPNRFYLHISSSLDADTKQPHSGLMMEIPNWWAGRPAIIIKYKITKHKSSKNIIKLKKKIFHNQHLSYVPLQKVL